MFILQPHPRPELIDKKVIDGHIIPNRVVFTKSAPIEQPFETLAFEDNIKVTVTFFTQGEGKNIKSMYSIFYFKIEMLENLWSFQPQTNCLNIHLNL